MRIMLSSIFGVVISLLLFLLMHTLISGKADFKKDDGGGRYMDFIEVEQDELVNLKKRVPPKKTTATKKTTTPAKAPGSRSI